MVELNYRPSGVCSQLIHLELDDDGETIQNVSFFGGCAGNLLAISKLVAGKPVDEIIEMLEGNPCGPRPTSCPDQLAKALRAAKAHIQGSTD